MVIDSHDLNKKVMVVAEIGNNHEGSYALAEEMIGLAAEAGVDAVKFQVFQTEHYVSGNDQNRFQRLKSFELSYVQYEKLAAYAKSKGLIVMATPFDIESALQIDSLVSAYKIASGDNTFYPLIETIASRNKPVILSTGLASMTQIRFACSLIQRIWEEAAVCQELAVLHCVTSYPVPDDQANLAAISILSQELPNCTIGYSDHTMGIDACILAVALGAKIIEKHFTVDKNYSDFRDHQLSADPVEMKSLVENIRKTERLLGSGQKNLQSCEEMLIPAVRRSIVAKHPLAAGAKVALSDITWVRPAGGLPPGKEMAILNKSLKKNVVQGECITMEIVE